MAKVIQFPMTQNPPIVWADISRYQASNPENPPVIHFDFDAYMSHNPPMICLRGQVANDGLDFEFNHNLAECRRLKLPYIIYHYIKLWKNIPNQIAAVSDLIQMVQGDPLYKGSRLDIETNDGLNKNTFTGNAEKMFSGIYGRTNELLWLYTRAYFWDANTYVAGWMKDIEWWIAHHFYGLNPQYIPSVRPLLAAAIAEINNPKICVDWQFDTHDGGFAWGSRGDNEIDLNFFVEGGGAYAAFQQRYGIAIVPPPPVIVPGAPLYRIQVLTDLNIRREAGKASPSDLDDGTLQTNTIIPIYAEETVPGWQHPFGKMGGWVYMNPAYTKKTTAS